MKTKLIALAVFAVAALFTGCWQKSVHPFYTDKDLFFEEKLLGEWRDGEKDADDAATWTFSKSVLPNVYVVNIVDKETKLDCDARLFKMGDTKFMDMYSRNRGVLDVPGHTLFRVLEVGESFKVQLLSPGWIKNRMQLNPKELSHVIAADPENPGETDKGEVILTAETERLQKFVKEHTNDEGFWEEPGTLKKVK